MKAAVYLQAAGVVSVAGRGLPALIDALRSTPPTPTRFLIDEIQPPLAVACQQVPLDFGASNRSLGLINACVDDVLNNLPVCARGDLGVFVASSSIDLLGQEAVSAAEIANGRPTLVLADPRVGALAEHLAKRYGLGGRQYTVNTACSSGANALIYAADAIRQGLCRQALVVGVECPTRVTLAGFHSMMLLAASACRPFDRDRDGIVLGETCSAVLLGREPAAAPWAGFSLAGGASACDSSSPTHTSAEAVVTVMRQALEDAECASLVAVKAHGTGTPHNDLAESLAIDKLFSNDSHPPMTAFKPVLGHTLGACGVLETVAAAACWAEGFLPGCGGLIHADPACPRVPTKNELALPSGGDMALNYFGFGGNNSTLILRRVE